MGLVLGSACQKDTPTLPQWWEYTAEEKLRRSDLLRQPIIQASAAEVQPYYSDSLGCTFRYPTPEGGVLWVEYFVRHETVRTVSLLWENDSFPLLMHLYQRLRQAYTLHYGPPRGPLEDLSWEVRDSVRIILRLSPERRYLHAAFSAIDK